MKHIADIIEQTIDITNHSTLLSIFVVAGGSIVTGATALLFLVYFASQMQAMIGAMLIFEVV